MTASDLGWIEVMVRDVNPAGGTKQTLSTFAKLVLSPDNKPRIIVITILLICDFFRFFVLAPKCLLLLFVFSKHLNKS